MSASPSRIALLAPLLALVLAACDTRPVGTPVTYRNDTNESINVTNDEHLVTTLAPRQSKAITTREDLLPDRIRAYTERGDLIFDQTFTWQDLQRLRFTIVITRTQ